MVFRVESHMISASSWATTEPMRMELWTDADAGHETRLRQALERGELAGALLAVEGAPAGHWNKLRGRLDAWGSAARKLVDARDGLTPAQALVRVLADEAGFTGDVEDYHHPRNSYLTQVVARRQGLPIVLACVYTLVGCAAGFDVCGVGMPGHFLVRVGDIFVDPFNGGKICDEDTRKEMLQEITAGAFVGRSEFFRDTPVSPTIERVLRNLVHSHRQRREREQLYRVVRLLASVTPDRADNQLLYARITEEVGAHRMALDLYEAIIEEFGDSPEAKLAATRLGPLHTRARMLN